MQFTALVSTPYASRYLQQLAKHWAHKFDVEFTPEQARISLPLGDVDLEAQNHALSIHLKARESADTDKMKSVVETHIDRFAHKEGGLSYDWQSIR